MAKDYFCPICKGQLRVTNTIILSAKSKKNEKGLIFLNSEIGEYSITSHPDFQIHEGEEYTFFCPICHTTLNREENPHLVKIHMKDGDEDFEIYFSSLAGEKCTYKISDKSIEQIGPDSIHYKQYFDVPDEDKKYL
ncbi:MAG: hypothetical protein PF485_13685 [Bacteroidales bacterium]|jgi:hypothetical protein|nr:hypothetical protein [Bacteroidales bacterium]